MSSSTLGEGAPDPGLAATGGPEVAPGWLAVGCPVAQLWTLSPAHQNRNKTPGTSGLGLLFKPRPFLT